MAVLASGVASSACADSFYLKNGQVIEGRILKGTLNTLTLSSGGSVQLTSFNSIERVVVELTDGSELSGVPLSWFDGVLELRSEGAILRIADGAIIEEQAVETEAAAADAPDEDAAAGEPDQVVSVQGLPSFTLKSGETVTGEVLHATGSVLTIRPVGGSATPISRAQIETVSITDSDGAQHSGKLLDWDAGAYRLQVGGRGVLANLDADTAKKARHAAAAQRPAAQKPEPSVAAEVEQADAAALPAAPAAQETAKTALATASTAEAGAGGPVNETAVAALSTDEAAEGAPATDDGRHFIETLVDPVDEGAQSVTFRFKLDKPAVRPLVVLYAATEASAKAGEDFEAKSGVITFSTGSSYAEVQVPIIDDAQHEDGETFNLFLSGDPETIAFSQRQIAVTINDND
ncbi:MAG: Calx-beta domain-containing protein [Alphaproteobacteria bacterium]